MNQERAIIDIGSNTVRLVIYNGPARAPVVLLNEKVTPRLGRDVAASGLLSEKSMEMTLSALRRYATLVDLMDIKDVQTVATAATRDAENGAEFLDAIRQLGLVPRLLSGEEEARTSAMGVIAAFPDADGVAGDLGGGSLELTRIERGQCHEAITLPLGTLRLPTLRQGSEGTFVKKIGQMLRGANWSHGRSKPFYIVGGSLRALALYAMDLTGWPLDDPHDFELSAKDATRICAMLAERGPKKTVSRISSARLEMLPDAAALLGALVESIGPSKLVFSSWGLREGLLFSSLPEDRRAEDPLIAGIAAFVKRYDISPRGADLIVDWIGESLPGSGDVSQALRHGATMLSLAAMRTEPNVRAEEALDWALRKRWIGLDSRGRALIATAVLANTGRTNLPREIERFADREDLDWAVSWGFAVRLSRKLANCNAVALARSSLHIDAGKLVLSLDDLTASLYSNSVAKNLGRLADWLGLEPEVRGPVNR